MLGGERLVFTPPGKCMGVHTTKIYGTCATRDNSKEASWVSAPSLLAISWSTEMSANISVSFRPPRVTPVRNDPPAPACAIFQFAFKPDKNSNLSPNRRNGSRTGVNSSSGLLSRLFHCAIRNVHGLKSMYRLRALGKRWRHGVKQRQCKRCAGPSQKCSSRYEFFANERW